VVDEACRDVPVPRDAVGADGTIVDDATQAAIAGALTALTGQPNVFPSPR
jgi:hypothetical protein